MIAHLQISTWVGSTVWYATHYYGRLYIGDNSVEVNRVLDAAGAAEMNKAERQDGDSGFTWEPGNTTGRFNSEEAVVQAAIAKIQAEYPEVTLVFKGDRGVLDPQPVLIGPEPLKSELNALVAEAEAAGWWEGDEEAMQNVFDRWYAIYKPLRFAGAT